MLHVVRLHNYMNKLFPLYFQRKKPLKYIIITRAVYECPFRIPPARKISVFSGIDTHVQKEMNKEIVYQRGCYYGAAVK